MGKLKEFLKRKDVVFSAHRYGIDAMGAMAQGLFASLLIGTIIKTLGEQIGLQFLVDAGTFAQSVAGPAMAASIGYALHTPPLVLFSLIAVGSAANSLGGAGGPLAVYFIAIVSAECGKLVSKETKVDIIVTPAVTILVGTGLSVLFAPAIGAAASAVGSVIMWATELQPLLMGILVSVLVGIALTLPISSAAICAALNLTGLAGGAAVAGCCAQMVGFAVMSFKENGVGGLVSQGIGTSMIEYDSVFKTGIQLKELVVDGSDPKAPYYRKGSAASHICADDIDKIDLTDVELVHVTGIPPALSQTAIEATVRLMERAKENGIMLTFDPNLRPALWNSIDHMIDVINKLSVCADVVLPGIGECETLLGTKNKDQIAAFYHSHGVKTVVIKDGKNGAFVSDKNGESTTQINVPGFHVEHVVDTVGAGDGFAVGFITRRPWRS